MILSNTYYTRIYNTLLNMLSTEVHKIETLPFFRFNPFNLRHNDKTTKQLL